MCFSWVSLKLAVIQISSTGTITSKALAWLDPVAQLYCLSADYAADRGIDFGVAEIELSSMKGCARLLEITGG